MNKTNQKSQANKLHLISFRKNICWTGYPLLLLNCPQNVKNWQVELVRELISDGAPGAKVILSEGLKGVIVEVYSQDGTGYEVEFFDDAGNTVALMLMIEQDIRLRAKDT